MRCFLDLLVPLMVLASCVAALAQTPVYNLGRTPSDEEIRAMDITISPSGKGLPPGSGTAKEGAKIYAQQCAYCHGPTGAEGRTLPGAPNLWPYSSARGRVPPSLLGVKGATLHGIWQSPVATTIWDYINRAMPPRTELSLSADEVYALTALLLHWNGIIQESDVIDAKSLPKIQMPIRTK